MQEKGLDFRFLLSRKIDPPLRSAAVREARAKRATTACCGGKIFFWGVFFAKTNPPHFENSAFFVEDLERALSGKKNFFFSIFCGQKLAEKFFAPPGSPKKSHLRVSAKGDRGGPWSPPIFFPEKSGFLQGFGGDHGPPQEK